MVFLSNTKEYFTYNTEGIALRWEGTEQSQVLLQRLLRFKPWVIFVCLISACLTFDFYIERPREGKKSKRSCNFLRRHPPCIIHMKLFHTLKKATVFEVVLDNDICHSIKHKLNIVCVCGACEMSVDFFGILLLIQVFKLHLDISRSFLKRIGPCQRQHKL